MICKTCQIAGDMVAETRNWVDGEKLNIQTDHTTVFQVPTKEAVRSVAHLFHGLCKGSGHCDCQHKVDFEGKLVSGKA